jgi:hypothetical protein
MRKASRHLNDGVTRLPLAPLSAAFRHARIASFAPCFADAVARSALLINNVLYRKRCSLPRLLTEELCNP